MALGKAQARADVFLAHDHLAQRGGAERVAQTLSDAFDSIPIHTSVYAPGRTYDSLAGRDIREMWFSRAPGIRSNHRWAFPLMAPGFSWLRSDAEVTIASSAGWSHGVRASGRKIVFWYSPPRWLYQQAEYLGGGGVLPRAVGLMAPALRHWDRTAVQTTDRHLAVSTEIANRLRRIYNVEAEVIHPPMMVHASPKPLDELPEHFLLAVSRLMSYKNLQHVAAAMRKLPDENLVIVGSGPFRAHLEAIAPKNVRFIEGISDGQLVTAYQRCNALVAAAFEDFGLTPLEAAAQGKPVVALRSGGFLDTVENGTTGVFFDTLEVDAIVAAIQKCLTMTWDESLLRAHAEQFSEERFKDKMRQVVAEEAEILRGSVAR